MPTRLDTRDPGFEAGFLGFLQEHRDAATDVDDVVAAIIADVRERGDAALLEYTRRFDRLDLKASALRFRQAEIDAATAACPEPVLEALRFAAARIEAFHRQQIPSSLEHTDEHGIRMGLRWTAVEAAGLYVPGGRAVYPSSVLMNAIPAKVAGVDRLVMVVPTPDGQVAPLVLAAAALAGVDEIYRIGGAQAIAALAHGTETIPRVDKIVGPGNAYVAAAKRMVFGEVGIDMVAGPSEIVVVADDRNQPDWIAADLLSQAEHDPSAQSVLITDSAAFAAKVEQALTSMIATLPRGPIAAESWRDNGAVIIVRDLNEAPALVDMLAPEHLELAVAEPQALADRVRHAGAIFLGRHTPEAVGDYVGGPNHVLPTSRTARYASGLSVLDFMKRTTWLACDAAGIAAIGPAAVTLAEAEGLTAHGLSVAVRLRDHNARTG